MTYTEKNKKKNLSYALVSSEKNFCVIVSLSGGSILSVMVM